MKFDLHIHSIASEYKEVPGIVDASTIDNIGILLKKLDENEVGLFSVTDHNRFYSDLYIALDNEIGSGKYNVKGLLAGVEFDVQLDSDMGKCHIITIFDAQNNPKNYLKIQKSIEEKLLKEQVEYYTKDEYESILKKIGLDVILIACQRHSLNQYDGNHNSLSESSREPKELIKTGYINALEFQRPNVEGILKDNLREIPDNIGLVMGSDCHEWEVYPKHDRINGNGQFSHSRAKILPTFKGLLMAVTSPETRINQQENRNVNYIDKFTFGDRSIQLVNGINAIIGENGSGKSTLLSLLHNHVLSRSYAKKIIEINNLSCENKDSSRKLFIEQGEIIKKFDECKLFPEDNFKEIDHSKFVEMYITYANEILKYIKENIAKSDAIKILEKKEIEYSELSSESTYFLQIECTDDFTNVDNIHESPKKNLMDIIYKLKTLQKDDYFEEYKNSFNKVIELLEPIYNKITQKYNKIDVEQKLKNIISSEISHYNIKISDYATTKEKDQRDFSKKRLEFIKTIAGAILSNSKELLFPEKPQKVKGFSNNASCGFDFNSEAKYHDKEIHNEFLKVMFNQNYANIEKLQEIDREEILVDAIRNCTEYDKVDSVYNTNLDKFIKQMCECKNYIIDISNEERQLGSTLGEQSLAYFKYITEYETDKTIFLIDQPEDHISNNNISNKLIKYFNSIRNKKQIIIVTHNPLLVVNQDVDQVIFIGKGKSGMHIADGCLEFENDEVNMLKLIADNMDGGKSAIEKRLRVYG